MYTYYLGGLHPFYSRGDVFTIHGLRGDYVKQEGGGVHNIQGSCISTVQTIILYYTGGEGADGGFIFTVLEVGIILYTKRFSI